jgi:hypothetical protein
MSASLPLGKSQTPDIQMPTKLSNGYSDVRRPFLAAGIFWGFGDLEFGIF